MYTPEKKICLQIVRLKQALLPASERTWYEVQRRIQSTKLKNRIVSHFPGMNPYDDRREVLVAFNADIGEVHGSSLSISFDGKG